MCLCTVGWNDEDGEPAQRSNIFGIDFCAHTWVLNMRVQVSMRGSETDGEEINSCSCEWEKMDYAGKE